MSSIRPRGKSWNAVETITTLMTMLSVWQVKSSACHVMRKCNVWPELTHLMDTTRSDVRSVHSGPGHSLIELKHLRGNKSPTTQKWFNRHRYFIINVSQLNNLEVILKKECYVNCVIYWEKYALGFVCMIRLCRAHFLSLLKHPEEGCHGSDVKGVRGDGHDMVQDASQLSIQN